MDDRRLTELLEDIGHELHRCVRLLRVIAGDWDDDEEPGPAAKLTGTVAGVPPAQLQGDPVANIELGDTQNCTITLGAEDSADNPVALAIDPGTLAASFADATEFVVTPDETTGTVKVAANGHLVQGDVLTITASQGGVALEPLTYTFDEVSGPATKLSGTVSAPVAN